MKHLGKLFFLFTFGFILINPIFSENNSNYKKSSIKSDSEAPSDSEKEFNFWGSQQVFKLSVLTDTLLLTGGASIYGTSLILEKVVKFNQPQLSEYNFDTSIIPTLDILLMNEYSKPLHYTGTALAATAMVTPAVFFALPADEWFTVGTMYAETLLWAQATKELTKTLVSRARPYMYFENYPEEKVLDGDWDDSFPSGHTTLAFSSAMFTSYVFCQYFPESKFRAAVISTSFGLATATAVFRVLSGNHYFSDVITGAVLGTMCGFLVPLSHKVNSGLNNKTNISLNPYGVNVTVKL